MDDDTLPDLSRNSRVKEGWLHKRGEHIKNWRPRFFILFDNGSLMGFKTRPLDDLTNPLNSFTVKGCQIMKADAPDAAMFLLRGLHLKAVIERIFKAESNAHRDEWITAIQTVAEDLKRDAAADTPVLSLGEPDVAPRELPVKRSDKVQRKERKITLEDFEFIKMLGKGTFGKVILCREKASSLLYAMKIIKKEVIIAKAEVVHTLTENRVLQAYKHPFLTQLKYSFQTNDRICFVMEYVIGGELFFHLSRLRVFTEDKARFYAAEILSAIGYLHEKGVVYRDLKLENILLDKDGHIKVTDFGLCKESIAYGTKTKTFCGTPEYLAPEVLDETDYGRAVDWWSLGVVIYEMMCGRLPFYNQDHGTLFGMIIDDELKIPPHISKKAKSLLSELLVKDPSRRLGGGPGDSADIKAHPFFSTINWEDLVNKKCRPPFKPQIADETDTRYFEQQFTGEPVELTPPQAGPLTSITEEETAPYFEEFSFHGNRRESQVSVDGTGN